MPVLSSDLFISPRGELVLGQYARFGEMHDIDSGDELFVPRGGFKVCGLCDSQFEKQHGLIEDRTAWISQD